MHSQTGILAFYFLVIGHVSRAWIMIGISVRLALALGLHLRNEDASLNDSRRESLTKTWWCLHSIECLVSSITGRPPVIGNEDCTVSLPQHTPESPTRQTHVGTNYGSPQTTASSSASESNKRNTDKSHYLHTYITLTIISQKVLLSLYSPRTAVQSWQVRVLFFQLGCPLLATGFSYMSMAMSLTSIYSTFRRRSRSCSRN
jgi:hypothetical protein